MPIKRADGSEWNITRMESVSGGPFMIFACTKRNYEKHMMDPKKMYHNDELVWKSEDNVKFR